MASAAWGLRTASRGQKIRDDMGGVLRRAGGGGPGEHRHGESHGESHSPGDGLHHDHNDDDGHMHRQFGDVFSGLGLEEDVPTADTRQGEDQTSGEDALRTAAMGEDDEDPVYGDEDGEELEAASHDMGRRSMQQTAVVPPAPIRLSVTYQMLSALDASQQQMLTRVVEAVRRILQKFVNVKRPSSGGMLVDPYCNLNTWSCYPDFISRSSFPERECGLATILRQHIVNPFNCTTSTTRAQREALGRGTSGPASGAGSGASGYGTGCSSFAGTMGEETDMYLYITAVQNDDCEAGAAAWARPCLLDLANNRPLLGAANVCPRALVLLDEDALTAVLTHEMVHALGFTDSMYNLTRRPDGSLRPRGELVANATVGGKQVQLLVGPNVRDAARAQFGCRSLAGAQLEEEGSAGSAGSHWEYTHYQGEVMVASTIFATDGTPPAFSNLTLSYLDDTGWYVTNRRAAGLLSWGAGAGCALPTRTCQDYMASVPGQRLFCDADEAASNSLPSFMCNRDYKTNGVCRALNFTGGCGMVVSRDAEQTCVGPNAANDMPEVFGWGTGSPSGRCLPVVYKFQASVGYNRYTYPALGRDGDADAACFETVCSADGSKVSVRMLGQTFDCPAGGYLNLAQLLPSRYNSGRIGPCPPASALCSTQSCPKAACNPTGGDCLNGTCYCRLAFTRDDCSFSLITGQPVTDSSLEAAGVGGAGGNSTTSPPPPMKVWTQVVQLTLAMENTVADVTARLRQLQAAIASWAGLSAGAVVITNVAGSSATLGTGSAAGDSYDATSTTSSLSAAADARRRGLQQVSAASPPPVAAASPPLATVPATPTAAAVATAWLTPSQSRPATMLLTWLKGNQTERDRLVKVLADGGFVVVSGGISSESIITQSMGSSPPPVAALTSATAPSDSNSARGRAVIIIALSVGAIAVTGIIATIVTVFVIRTRRARRRQAASSASRAHLYQVPHSTPGIGSGPSAFGVGSGHPPPSFGGNSGPSAAGFSGVVGPSAAGIGRGGGPPAMGFGGGFGGGGGPAAADYGGGFGGGGGPAAVDYGGGFGGGGGPAAADYGGGFGGGGGPAAVDYGGGFGGGGGPAAVDYGGGFGGGGGPAAADYDGGFEGGGGPAAVDYGGGFGGGGGPAAVDYGGGLGGGGGPAAVDYGGGFGGGGGPAAADYGGGGAPSSNPFANTGPAAYPGTNYGPSNPEAAARGYYNNRAAGMMAPPSQEPQQPSYTQYMHGAQPQVAPLYAGPQQGYYS
ncbi:hypothetical protein PLESTB_001582300 [Pleodorina starrii]|uniref:Uncharacterized protein n=1 Tax=Pleodorina starrii TaxID=330485 RepID=A0A9W6F8E2_9CHLO|nr:hypothetical protein PLESTB_001582300 [Pleodorina starrii]